MRLTWWQAAAQFREIVFCWLEVDSIRSLIHHIRFFTKPIENYDPSNPFHVELVWRLEGGHQSHSNLSFDPQKSQAS